MIKEIISVHNTIDGRGNSAGIQTAPPVALGSKEAGTVGTCVIGCIIFNNGMAGSQAAGCFHCHAVLVIQKQGICG